MHGMYNPSPPTTPTHIHPHTHTHTHTHTHSHIHTHRMICEIHGISPPPSSSQQNGGINISELSLSSSLASSLGDDLTPNITPTASPVLSARHRIISISNPEPVLKLVVEGLLQKSTSLLESLEDKLLQSILEESNGILVPTGKGQSVSQIYC